MRVLFAASPGLGHLFPLISLAWALRASGHEVLVATSQGAADAAVKAGLQTVDVAPDTDFAAIFGRFVGFEERARQMKELGKKVAAGNGGGAPDIVLEMFGAVSDAMADGIVRLAQRWRPDVVVHSMLQGAGPLAARRVEVPSVVHGFGFMREGVFGDRYPPHLRSAYERNGVPLELPRRAAIHVGPPSMMTGAGEGWAMRYVPYNAGGLLPEWLTEPRRRPRIGVTLGTVVPHMGGIGGLRQVVTAAAALDAEFVLALGDDIDTSPLGELPDNVRVVGWVPLNSLLAECDVLVHHGGAGTTMTALCAGVPQLVLPHGADQFVNAEIVAKFGIGLTSEPSDVDSELLATLLGNEAMLVAAAEVRAEIERMPAPVDLVPKLAELVG